MVGATGACNSGKMTLSTGQRPGSKDENRKPNRAKDNMMSVMGGGVWHDTFTAAHEHRG